MNTKTEKSSSKVENAIMPDCFILMPIADPDGYDKGHFKKVYEDIISVACKKSGYNAIRADEVKETNLIHLDILKKLIESPMAICDLSNRNPNVLFELGLRQAFDKPTVLIQECGTPKIFDISPLRYTEYRKELKYREVLEDQKALELAITATKNATEKGEGVNSLINLLSLSNPASLKDIGEKDTAKMLQVVMAEMNEMRSDFRRSLRRFDERNEILNRDKEELAFEYERATMEFREFISLIDNNAPEQIIREFSDRIQHRLFIINERSNSSLMRKRTNDLLREIDIYLSKYYSNKK